ncbi:MAG: amidohydrolase, partial [Streptomyces sp.]|nr:amidohydrolase [Streptomyces sp.]
HPFVAIMDPDGSDHTPEFATAAASDRARRVLLAATEALACTAVELLLSAELREQAWREHGGSVAAAARR